MHAEGGGNEQENATKGDLGRVTSATGTSSGVRIVVPFKRDETGLHSFIDRICNAVRGRDGAYRFRLVTGDLSLDKVLSLE